MTVLHSQTIFTEQPIRRSDTARILANAQHRIDQIWAGALGRYAPKLALWACGDVLLQAGRDLDWAAAHRTSIVQVRISTGGGQ